MIRVVNLSNSMSNLKTLLSSYVRQDPEDLSFGMFSSVEDTTKTYSGTSYTGVRCNVILDDSEVPCLDIFHLSDGTLHVITYYNGSTAQDNTIKQSATVSSVSPSNKLAYAYSCENGVLINFELNAGTSSVAPLWYTIMITKGNDGLPFVILSFVGTSYTGSTIPLTIHSTNVRVCHITDTSYLDTNLIMRQTSAQNAMVPFMGYGNLFEVTHAPYAYWLAQSSAGVRNSGFAMMRFNGLIDGITNGYWVILEGEIGGDPT